eukprot:gene3856-4366_t
MMRILDSAFLNEEIAATAEQRAYEEKVLTGILVGNEMAYHILGATGFAQLKPEGGPTQMSAELKAVEARPDINRYYDPTSISYAQAMAKIRGIVHLSAGIIINEEA